MCKRMGRKGRAKEEENGRCHVKNGWGKGLYSSFKGRQTFTVLNSQCHVLF